MDKKVENEAKTSFTKYQTAKKQLVLRSIIRKTSSPENTIIVHQDDSDTVSEKSVQLTESMKDTLEV